MPELGRPSGRPVLFYSLGSALNTGGGRDRPGKVAGKERAEGRVGQPVQGARRPQPPSPADREAAGCPLPPGRRHSIGHDESSSLPPRSLPNNKCQPVTTASGAGFGPLGASPQPTARAHGGDIGRADLDPVPVGQVEQPALRAHRPRDIARREFASRGSPSCLSHDHGG